LEDIARASIPEVKFREYINSAVEKHEELSLAVTNKILELTPAKIPLTPPTDEKNSLDESVKKYLNIVDPPTLESLTLLYEEMLCGKDRIWNEDSDMSFMMQLSGTTNKIRPIQIIRWLNALVKPIPVQEPESSHKRKREDDVESEKPTKKAKTTDVTTKEPRKALPVLSTKKAEANVSLSNTKKPIVDKKLASSKSSSESKKPPVNIADSDSDSDVEDDDYDDEEFRDRGDDGAYSGTSKKNKKKNKKL